MRERQCAVYACRRCGAPFEVNVRRWRRLGTLWGVACVPAILLLALVFATLSAPDSVAFLIFLLPIGLCLWAQAGIRCLTPLKQDKEQTTTT